MPQERADVNASNESKRRFISANAWMMPEITTT
jgi:hypothetical protein